MKECLIESNIFLFNQKSNISDVYYYSHIKIEIDSYVDLPGEKTLSIQNTATGFEPTTT